MHKHDSSIDARPPVNLTPFMALHFDNYLRAMTAIIFASVGHSICMRHVLFPCAFFHLDVFVSSTGGVWQLWLHQHGQHSGTVLSAISC
jgi:hypothetical protein